MKHNAFDILRQTGYKESAVNFNFHDLMRDVRI
jgi:hypothetical protein